jgi:hypothetical protein
MHIWGSGGIAPPFLTSALNKGEGLHAPVTLRPGERVPGTHFTGGWVGPRAAVKAVEKTKIRHCRESNPGRQPVARRYAE